MIRFNNDYNHGAFASILKELGATNSTSYAGYGEDEWCDKAETIIKKLVDNDDALIKFIPGATQANYVVIAAALSSVQSVIAADTGHINCHEAASIENTGHKILELPNTDGIFVVLEKTHINVLITDEIYNDISEDAGIKSTMNARTFSRTNMNKRWKMIYDLLSGYGQ